MSPLSAILRFLLVWSASAHGGHVSHRFLSALPKPGAMSVEQRDNSIAEDQLADKIWKKLVNTEASSCTVLRKMINAYVHDKSVWDFAKDAKNPEFPKEMCPDHSIPDPSMKGKTNQGGINAKEDCGDDKPVTTDADGVQYFNDMLTGNRKSLRIIAAHASCSRALDLLGDPVPIVRNGAVWELVFKNDETDWSNRLDGGFNGPNNADQKQLIVKAYDQVRCGGHSPCHKGTPDVDINPMFRFKKGRGGFGERLLGTQGGIAWSKEPAGVVDGKTKYNDVEGSLVGFWAGGQHSLTQHDQEECQEERLNKICQRKSHRNSDRDGVSTNKCALVRASCALMKRYSLGKNHAAKSIWDAAIPLSYRVNDEHLGTDDPVDLANPDHVTEAGHVTFHFKKCGVPWIGGVSGSVLEFFGMLEKAEPGKIDDLLVLQWMAYYELKGFHSLGEVFTALHPFLVELGYDKGTNKLAVLLQTVDPPMTTQRCDVSKSTEQTFLSQLGRFVEWKIKAEAIRIGAKHDRVLKHLVERTETVAQEKQAVQAEKQAQKERLEGARAGPQIVVTPFEKTEPGNTVINQRAGPFANRHV